MIPEAANASASVLVLDASERSALAATRSLGRAGYRVLVADEKTKPLAGASRYCSDELQYPSPYRTPEAFLDWFGNEYQRQKFRIALPMTEVTTDLLTRNRSEWPHLILPFAPIETIDHLSDKVLLYERAVELDIPVPESVVVRSRADLELAIRRIGFPAFIKPRRSRLLRGGAFLSTTVHKVENITQLLRLYELPQFCEVPFLYQRPAPGSGRGVFVLFNQGEPITFFCHRRVREKPPTGGVSVLSESWEVDSRLRDYATRLLGSVNWHGVAMVEFKGDEKQVQLMEVNARFWGSLQLAIDAGVNFPVLLIQSELRGAPIEIPQAYRLGIRLRWLLGDVDHLYLVFKADPSWKTRARAILDFLRPDLLRTRQEVFRWNDPRPAFREAIHYIASR